MTLTTATAGADKYSRAWEKVDNYIKEDLPESAAKVITQIWDMAADDGDGRQMLKSAVYLTQVQQTYSEESLIDGINLFKTLLGSLKVQEHKALCHAFLAKGYMTYLENAYPFHNILPTDEENPPLERWTRKMICDTICYHLDQSIRLAGNVGSGFYQEFFPGGNKAGQKLRPLLVDMLMDNAVVLVTDYELPLGKRKFLDDPRLYGSMQSFLEATREVSADDPDLWQFYVLRQLVNHNYAAKPNIRCTIDIRRMTVLNEYLDDDGEWNKNDEEWLKGAVALAESYTKKVKFSTLFYSMAARKIENSLYEMSDAEAASLRRQARDMCIAAQRKWPKSEGALDCMGIRSNIERKEVNIDFQQDFLPGERNIARLDYRNTSSVYIKVVEVPGQFKEYDEVSLLSQLNQCNAVAEWSMHVNDPGDYMQHYTMMNIPPVMQGSYYLMASTGPYFSSGDCIAYQYIECNGIQFVRLIQNNGTVYGVAVNTRTGKPIPDCKYTLWRTNSNGDAVQVATSGITPPDGTILLEGYYNGRFKLELESGANHGSSYFYIPYNSDWPEGRYNIQLYTDRYTYLPGDSIQFSGIVYAKSSQKGAVMPDTEIKVYALGSRMEELIGTFKTDEMGAFKGSYKIPDSYMPGSMNLRAEMEQNMGNNGWTQVNVESFRQPKFEVILDRCRQEVYYDKTVTLTGSAKSFTGVPLDSATVDWYAGVNRYMCHCFCMPDDRGYVRVGAGQVKTAPDGTFSFDVTVPSDILVNESGRVTVIASVTDLNGESHETMMTFIAAQQEQSRNIYITVPNGIIERNGQKTLQIRLNSSNGPVKGRINVKVSRLTYSETPGLPLPFSVSSGKMTDELWTAADNLNIRDKFPLYDFDFKGENAIETVIFEGVVPYDPEDPESSDLILDGLKSGMYRITADAQGFPSATRDVDLCREDDYSYVDLKSLLWAYDGNNGNILVEVGDTARIRLGSSRKGAIIHYYIENKYGVVERGSMEAVGDQQVLSIPVTPELKGYFSVSCAVLYEGVMANKSFEFRVPDRDKQLKMQLVTFRSQVEPDVDEEWKLQITDWEGNPVKAAVMLDMYDSALDEYGTNNFSFNPFSPAYVSGRTLLERPRNYANQYMYWIHMFADKYQYKGKRAITGMLINPFEYKYNRYMIKARGVPTWSSATLGSISDDMIANVKAYDGPSDANRMTGIDDGREETLLDLQMDDSAGEGAYMLSEMSLASEEIVQQVQPPVPLRTDMNPTGLFEYLITDSTGTATVHFRTPQLLTRWNVRGLSYTDSLKTAYMDTTLVTRKLIMVEPSAPRFLREGDRMEFTVKVSNMMEQSTKATVIMTMTDAVTGRALGIIEGGYKKNVTLPASGSASTSFTVKVPAGLTAVTYRLTAETTGHSDGMEETIPVLSNRTQVTQALSLFNNGSEKRSFHFEVLDRPRTTTMQDERLTLEYSATPIWYAIQNLPIMIRCADLSTLSMFYSMMGAAISQNLCRRYPVIREMLDEWSQLPASEWQTQLERNEDLTGTLLDETPWVMANRSERDRLRDLARNLGSTATDDAFNFALERLIATQNYDGGWSWMPGFETSMYVTAQIMEGLGLLIENGIIEETTMIKSMVTKGISYLDNYYFKEYDVKEKPKSLGYDQLYYLLIRTYFKSYDYTGSTQASHTYFTRLADIQDTHDLNLYYRAQLALLMSRTGKKDQAKHITATLLERSLYDDEMGRYWRDNAGGMMWYDAPIETQSTIIRLLLEVGQDTQAAEAARWLLKQKQTTGWGSSPATAQAVTALLAAGASTQLESDPDITIYVGKEALQASTQRATAGFTTQSWEGPISRDKADILIDAKTPGISWGAIYRTFTETLDNIESQSNGMTLKRTIWRIIHGADGDRLEEVKPGTTLHVGDQLRIRFDLTTDRNLEYLQLSDMRPATVEPMSTRGGFIYNWSDDIGYYVAPNNTRNVFYIYRLSKGSYVIEYDVKVQKPGHFTVGNAVMQCLYAPAFRATTESTTIEVSQ